MTDAERVRAYAQASIQDERARAKEHLNRIGAQLRVEYDDFDMIRDEPMTAELGENLRAQLESVFAILKKNGIDCGR